VLPVRLLASQVNPKGEEFQVENVRPLFPGPSVATGGQLFDVIADGKRFLVSRPPSVGSPPLTRVLNWTAALKKK
jgi:hypothetical protein